MLYFLQMLGNTWEFIIICIFMTTIHRLSDSLKISFNTNDQLFLMLFTINKEQIHFNHILNQLINLRIL